MNYLNKKEVEEAIDTLFPGSLVSTMWVRKEQAASTTLNLKITYTISDKEAQNVAS